MQERLGTVNHAAKSSETTREREAHNENAADEESDDAELLVPEPLEPLGLPEPELGELPGIPKKK
jgi:hypothetical protein